VSERILIDGNEATARGAIAGGCRHFFGYPITPQSHIPEYMSRELPKHGGVYLQAESEVAAINMCYGAAACGVRTMTTSSSPGVSLMQEGISYMYGAELPAVIVNMVRGGPGLGNIAAAQSDYWLSTRGGGHGDGQCLTLAPWSVQECYDMTYDSFDLAFKYRNPVVVLGDAIIAQMMEPVTPRPFKDTTMPEYDWAIGGERQGRDPRAVSSIYIAADDLENTNLRIAERYRLAEKDDTKWEEMGAEEPEVLVCAYGIAARICQTAVELAAERGVGARLIRPLTLFPFPTTPIRDWSERVKRVLVVELSLGQFIDDVRLSVEGRCPVELAAHTGGMLFSPEEVAERLVALSK
jgi:2-oxoglutarate ferredoxin oxidoreductase subunit alpha